MAELIKRNIFFILILFLIGLIYFLLRLPNLTLQPIFADEAIYIRWAQIIKAEPTLRFISLSDGKTPLFMWAMTPLFKIFTDPLFAGRFLSVLSGFLTLLGVLFLGWKFFNKSVGLWAAFLVACVPFMVFFDRMALVDSLLAAFSIWSLNLALLLIEYHRIDLAMFLGYTLGAGLLTKTPGLFNLLVLPLSLLSLNWRDKNRQTKLLKIFGLWTITIIVTMLIYNILRLGPGFTNLSTRNQDYMFSPLELVGRPLDPFLPHLNDLMDWLPKMLTLPVFILVILGVALTIFKRNKHALVILFWSLVPLLIQMALLKTFTARYILFSIPPLLCLAGWTIYLIYEKSQKLKLKSWFGIILALIILLPLSLYFNFKLLTDPASAPLPNEERRGYLEDWTAGYGFPEIAQFVISETQKGMVVVGTEGNFGTLPDGLQIYLDKHSHTSSQDRQVVVIGGNATISAQLRQASLEHPTFFVTNKSRFPLYSSGLKLLKEYPKAQGKEIPWDAILLFEVLPK